MDFDPLLLSRIQFAFVVSFHILFPAFTIGLASWLAMLEGLWLKTGREKFRELYGLWVKIFAVSFGMGVVSGIVMSFQFGTNWSRFSSATGNILGPLMSYEVLTAFFLEAGFLGIMLFGWQRVGKGLHFFATLMVALGTLMSAFWILSANSWMHTPAGYTLQDGVFYADDWLAIIFNPSFPYRLMHMVLAAYLTTAFVVAGVSAWYLNRNQNPAHAKTMFLMAMGFISIVAPLQIIAGDLHGLNVREHQPAKLAAMEAHWDSDKVPVPFVLFALPDEKQERNRFEIAIPYAGSLLLTHELDGAVQGLKDFLEAERPPVAIVFWAFRIMLAIGVLMLFIGFCGLLLYKRARLYDTPWFLRLCTLATPSGFVAVISGWVTAEVGRQPYVVYGLMRTADAISPVAGGSVAASFAGFIAVYAIVFGAGIYYIVKLVRRGPDEQRPHEGSVFETPARPLSAS
ncbi:MAG TPA: cytochrome ubiquinol oxidase subunit I [Burkholderiales bacterium]|nr:cytochrome ubiquinol oxidase subunit I [Burkholderiales bacterium]